jgi:hypothetical protein
MGKLLEGYRPELHYMRGPGPKWLEKHGQVSMNCPAPKDSELAKARGWREAVLNRLKSLSVAHQPDLLQS